MLKVLFLEDNEADQVILKRLMRDVTINLEVLGFEETILGAQKKVNDLKPDLIFCDFSLEDGTAVDFLNQLKDKDETPVIIISSHRDIDKAISTLKLGAYDFIEKDKLSAIEFDRIIHNTIERQKERLENRRLNADLRESYSNIESVLKNTHEGIWSVKSTGDILLINDRAVDLLEQITGRVVGKGLQLQNSVNGILKDNLIKHISEGLNGATFVSVEEYGKSLLCQESFIIEISSSPIYEAGHVKGVTFFAQDVTAREQNRIDLEKAKELAEKASVHKTQFLANMSHEIRTPMNSMLGFADLLFETPLSPEQKKYVDIIRNSGADLLVIINDILDLSKIQAGKMTLRETEFELDQVLRDIVRLHRYKAEDKGNFLNLNLDPELPQWLKGDGARLAQILNNLISNAIKFTENGLVGLQVKPLKIDGIYAALEFTVKDSGIGIPKDQLSFIFDDFTQIDSDLQRKHHGTGLGLPIVASLVDLMGGEINVLSEVGKGTEFIVQIPFAIVPQKSVITQVDSPQVSVFDGKKILVVDDVELNRVLIGKVLSKFDTQVEFAVNGQEAVEFVEKKSFDFVFMDVQMPIMNGLDATKKIRLFDNIPIIAITSHSMREEMERCLSVGMNGFVSKPFKVQTLIEEVETVLNTFRTNIRDDKESKNELKESNMSDQKDIWESLDLPTLKSLSEGDLEFAVSLMESYLELVIAKIKEFKVALDNNDEKTIISIAHMFQSSSVTFDFKRMKALADKIELKNSSYDDLQEFLRLLEDSARIIERKKLLLEE